MARHAQPPRHAAPTKRGASHRTPHRGPSPALPVLAVALTGVATFGAAALGTTQAAADPQQPASGKQVLSAPTSTVEAASRGRFGPSTRDLAREALQDQREEQQASDTRKPGPASLPPRHDDGRDAPEVVSKGQCEASFYDTGSVTANGERFDTSKLTAAHKSLPFDTKVRVINKANDKSAVVRINDRGPYVAGRCLDLTPPAMKKIAGSGSGTAHVRYEVLGKK